MLEVVQMAFFTERFIESYFEVGVHRIENQQVTL